MEPRYNEVLRITNDFLYPSHSKIYEKKPRYSEHILPVSWPFVNSRFHCSIQLFRERLTGEMCTRQSRKVIWDMINTLFVTTEAVELLLLLSFSTRKHMSVASCTILSNFFEEQCPQSHPQYLSRLSRALFPTTFLEIAVYIFLTGQVLLLNGLDHAPTRDASTPVQKVEKKQLHDMSEIME